MSQSDALRDWLATLARRPLIVLESYRRDGRAVQTPLLFIVEDSRLYCRTPATTNKVRRLRRNPAVRVASAGWRGRPATDWREGRAAIYPAAEMAWVNERFKRKYGLYKWLVDRRNALRRPVFVVIAITLDQP
jgi:PPOX class probable F420-dependent enzyme